MKHLTRGGILRSHHAHLFTTGKPGKRLAPKSIIHIRRDHALSGPYGNALAPSPETRLNSTPRTLHTTWPDAIIIKNTIENTVWGYLYDTRSDRTGCPRREQERPTLSVCFQVFGAIIAPQVHLLLSLLPPPTRPPTPRLPQIPRATHSLGTAARKGHRTACRRPARPAPHRDRRTQNLWTVNFRLLTPQNTYTTYYV